MPLEAVKARLAPPAPEKVHMATHRFFLRGEIDIASASQLRSDLEELVRASVGDIVLDCSGLTFIDSSGVAAIVFTRLALEERGDELRIANINGVPARLLDILGLTEVLHVNEASPEHPETELMA
ncbi:MAG: anti-sigma factor antagonist [Actinomycetota bacterium]|nr:anti-sigma factor antagonist [Actinomycetota bacterium]